MPYFQSHIYYNAVRYMHLKSLVLLYTLNILATYLHVS